MRLLPRPRRLILAFRRFSCQVCQGRKKRCRQAFEGVRYEEPGLNTTTSLRSMPRKRNLHHIRGKQKIWMQARE